MIRLTAISSAALLALLLLLSGCGSSSSSVDPAAYHVEPFNGWNRIANEEEVNGYIENAWRDPESPVIAIDTRAADETGSPMANAALARIQSYKLPGYKERGMKWIRLAGKPAVRWAFHTAGGRSGIDYFFEECGISFVVRGTMGNIAYVSLSESFREMATTIKVKGCSE